MHGGRGRRKEGRKGAGRKRGKERKREGIGLEQCFGAGLWSLDWLTRNSDLILYVPGNL